MNECEWRNGIIMRGEKWSTQEGTSGSANLSTTKTISCERVRLFVCGLLWTNGLSLYGRQRTYSIDGVIIWQSNRSIRGKSLSLPLLSPQNPQRVTWIYALVFSVRSRTKITWAMARHFFVVKSRIWFFFSVALQPKSILGHGIVEVSRSHKIRHTHPVGLLWQNDQLVAEAVTYRTHIK